MADVEKKAAVEGDIFAVERANNSKERQSHFIVTPEEESAVIRKLDWHLLPLVFALYTLSILDRSNLGNAKLAGLSKDIDLSGNRYSWLGTIFYIGYITSQWTQIGFKHFKPHIWVSSVVVVWGLLASVQAAVTSWGGLMALRFLLAIPEAAFGPGVPLYLSFFYPRDKVAFRHGVFISGAAMANVYGGLLAYGITQIKGSLAPWKILFLIEGLPTLIFAVIAFCFMPDGILEAKFLTEREKEIAVHMTARNQELDVGKEHGIRFKELLAGIRDPKSFIPAFCYFGCNVSFASLPLFLPTIISEMGSFTIVQSQGLSSPPYLLCFFVIITLCFLSDYFKMRGPFVALAAITGAVGFIIQATCSKTGPRYFGVFLSVQIFASIALLLAWTANIHATESKRAGAYTGNAFLVQAFAEEFTNTPAVLATIGQCGPLLGTNIFPTSEKPYYRKGMWISAAMCLMVAVLAGILSSWLIYENKKMEREGVPEVEEFEETSVAREDGQRLKHRFIW
ncbi:Hypothetical protein R9X50_00208500 [Acrodontium crateriforme]|uniref:MFS general substrate transporter n=1 Tax=Acrodontium crateriforme TaxID=150365 RepID=A0AAQ3M384_9PEZI|nr:Hypothetical protein R9X50_00208500 [Acrodontium crateriforme]